MGKFISLNVPQPGVTGKDLYAAAVERYRIATNAVTQARNIEREQEATRAKATDARAMRKLQTIENSARREMDRLRMQETSRLAKEREAGVQKRFDQGQAATVAATERPFERAREYAANLPGGQQGVAPGGMGPLQPVQPPGSPPGRAGGFPGEVGGFPGQVAPQQPQQPQQPGLLSPEAPPAQSTAFETIAPPPAPPPLQVPAGMGRVGERFEQAQEGPDAGPRVPTFLDEARETGASALKTAQAEVDLARGSVAAEVTALKAGGLRRPSDTKALRSARKALQVAIIGRDGVKRDNKILERQATRGYVKSESAAMFLNDIRIADTIPKVKAAAKKAISALGIRAAAGIRVAEKRKIAEIIAPLVKAAKLEEKVQGIMATYVGKKVVDEAGEVDSYVMEAWVRSGDTGPPPVGKRTMRYPTKQEQDIHELRIRKALGAPIPNRLRKDATIIGGAPGDPTKSIPMHEPTKFPPDPIADADAALRRGQPGVQPGAGAVPDTGIGEAAIRAQAAQKGDDPSEVARAYRKWAEGGPGASSYKHILLKNGYNLEKVQ